MKKSMSKIWSIGLLVVILASLLAFAAPVSAANPLQWNQEAVPTAGGYKLQPASENVSSIAVGGDGTTLYVASGGTSIYKSTNAGQSWSKVPTTNGNQSAINPTLVAVAPDNNNLLAIADTVRKTVYISTNGGASWGTLQSPTNATAINSLDVSAFGQTSNYLAVGGTISTGAEVWYYALGIGGIWTQTSTLGGFSKSDTATLAVKFSPSFSSDMVLTVVTTNSTGSGTTNFEMFSINQKLWNNAASFGSGYPVSVKGTTSTAFAASGAAIALAPTYLGGDETSRVAFVGAAGTYSGIYRIEDTTVTYIKSGISFYSVAYDGNNLVAGTTGRIVWRSPNALDSSPNFYPSNETKSPGSPASGNTIVAYVGTNVVAGTSGAESAYSVSTDSGASFNDLSLIRATLTSMKDFAVSADGSITYLITADASATSVWRYDSAGWQRVLALADITNSYIARIAPANPQVVYIAAVGALPLYYSKAGGDTKWYTRTGPHLLGDLAVEDDNIAYIGWSNGANVQKTLNGGFTWSTAADTQTGATGISCIKVLSAGNVIVGGNNGYVGYTTDSSSTWTKISQPVGSYTGSSIQVTANGLDSGKLIIAAAGGSSYTQGIWIWTIGQPSSSPWTNQDTTITSMKATGIQLSADSKWLYVASSNTTNAKVYRSADWTRPNPPSFDVITATYSSTGLAFDRTPQAMVVTSSTESNKIWAIDTVGAQLYSFGDTMAVVAPTLSTPATKAIINVNAISGNVYNVTFTWPAVSGVIYPTGTYELKLTLDADGTQVITDPTNVAFAGGVVSYTYSGLNPNTTYYWKVRTKLPVTSLWSEQRSFTTGTTPEIVPAVLTPANGESITSTTPSFSWSPIAGATKYQFQLALNTDFAPTVVDQTSATSGVRPIVKLNTDMTYFWRVRALEPIAGGWSTVSNFDVTVPVETVPPTTTVVVPTITIPPITIPAATVTVQPSAPQQPVISSGLLWAVIIIGAILVIALIVLIVRTRRSV